jgi:membrane-associated protein
MEEFFQKFWDILLTLLDPRNLTNPDAFRNALNQPGVFWSAFAAVNLIIFTETGLLIGFLLPGDSLLVVLGIVCQLADWNVWLLAISMSCAAILGDTVGYWIGAKAGPKIFSRPDGRFFKQEYLLKAREFYERHGGKTIIIARFIPIIRTFVPVVAGAAKMNYRWFLFYNIFGGIAWIFSMLLFGYYLLPIADPILQDWLGKKDFTLAKHIDKLALAVVLVSISPMLLKAFTEWRKKRNAKPENVDASVPQL